MQEISFPINSVANIRNASEGEDDEDVVVLPKDEDQKSLLPASPFLNVGKNYNQERKNPIIRAFIENCKNLDSAWTEAAESVFSDSHPFKVSRQNKTIHVNDVAKEIESTVTSDKGTADYVVPFIINNVNKQKATKEQKITEPPTNQLQTTHDKNNGQQQSDKETTAALKKQNNCLDTCSQPVQSGDEKKRSKKKGSTTPVVRKNSSHINSERLMHIKSKVEMAVRQHKVYSMTGHYGSVRRALRERGWLEKIDSDRKGRRSAFRMEESDGSSLLMSNKVESKETRSQCEAEIINRMLRNITEDLCWLSKPYPYCWKDINKCDMINRLPKAYFSNKVGLANSLANMQWYYEAGVCSTQYPRTYNISVRDELEAFQEDFRLTACVSTLKWLTRSYKQGGEAAVWSFDGRVDTNIIDFAIKRCTEYVRFREHEDIDVWEMPRTWDHQWDHFLTQYYKLVNESNILREIKHDIPITVMLANAQAAVSQLQPYWPQMEVEGIHDWWIVKPGGRCCGNGIVIRNNLDQIMAIVNPSVTRETRYVVQKYIERPLLIYNTKFDIRQWFLVTNVYPLTIWMYKESYLRFCSTTYSLKNMHESIHLCNNAVQRRYKNGKRDSNLPDENMWDCYTFQTHLKSIGYPDVWDELIYPGMRESFVGALLASQDNMERRRNCFELYGADFMVSEQITDGPWLIEINSNPAMDASTSVTARMCPQVLEDIIKVVIDRRNDRSAPTGAFELAYRQNCPPIPPYLGMSLCLKGKKVYKSPESRNPRRPNFHHQSSSSNESSSSESEENIVQRRCCTDFMAPIKTLRDEIQRLGRHNREDYLAVKNENLSDSWANDSDTSRGSTDRRMTLEGKEIELKKKKIRKKRHKNGQHYVVNKTRAYLDKKEGGKLIGTKHDSCKSAVEKNKSIRNAESHGKVNMTCQRTKYSGGKVRDQLQECNCSGQEKSKGAESNVYCNGELKRPLIITGLWEPGLTECGKHEQKCGDDADHGAPTKPSSRHTSPSTHNPNMYLRVEGEHYSSRDNSNSSRGSLSSLAESDKNSYDANEPMSNYDKRRRERDSRISDADLSAALNITAPELLVKTRNKSSRWHATKSSMDYFREWKYKIDETRRNCEDVLNKLRRFKEDNSRKKFQDLIRQRIDEENQNIIRVKQVKPNEDSDNIVRGRARRLRENYVDNESVAEKREGRRCGHPQVKEACVAFQSKVSPTRVQLSKAPAQNSYKAFDSLPKIRHRTLASNGNELIQTKKK